MPKKLITTARQIGKTTALNEALGVEINTLRAKLDIAVDALEQLAEPCTRVDYTAAKLDEVVTDIAKNALMRLKTP